MKGMHRLGLKKLAAWTVLATGIAVLGGCADAQNWAQTQQQTLSKSLSSTFNTFKGSGESTPTVGSGNTVRLNIVTYRVYIDRHNERALNAAASNNSQTVYPDVAAAVEGLSRLGMVQQLGAGMLDAPNGQVGKLHLAELPHEVTTDVLAHQLDVQATPRVSAMSAQVSISLQATVETHSRWEQASRTVSWAGSVGNHRTVRVIGPEESVDPTQKGPELTRPMNRSNRARLVLFITPFAD